MRCKQAKDCRVASMAARNKYRTRSVWPAGLQPANQLRSGRRMPLRPLTPVTLHAACLSPHVPLTGACQLCAFAAS
jgi:hypothetical protein